MVDSEHGDAVQAAPQGEDGEGEPAAGEGTAAGGQQITYGTPHSPETVVAAADAYIADGRAGRPTLVYLSARPPFAGEVVPLDPGKKPYLLTLRKVEQPRVEGSEAEAEIRWFEGSSERLSQIADRMVDVSGPNIDFPSRLELAAELLNISTEIKRRAAVARDNLQRAKK